MVLYCGEVFTAGPQWRFALRKFPVEDCGALGLRASDHYFQGPHFSSQFFESRSLDRDLWITDFLSLYYSTDKEKCEAFLRSKKEQALSAAKHTIEMIESAEIIGLDTPLEDMDSPLMER